MPSRLHYARDSNPSACNEKSHNPPATPPQADPPLGDDVRTSCTRAALGAKGNHTRMQIAPFQRERGSHRHYAYPVPCAIGAEPQIFLCLWRKDAASPMQPSLALPHEVHVMVAPRAYCPATGPTPAAAINHCVDDGWKAWHLRTTTDAAHAQGGWVGQPKTSAQSVQHRARVMP